MMKLPNGSSFEEEEVPLRHCSEVEIEQRWGTLEYCGEGKCLHYKPLGSHKEKEEEEEEEGGNLKKTRESKVEKDLQKYY